MGNSTIAKRKVVLTLSNEGFVYIFREGRCSYRRGHRNIILLMVIKLYVVILYKPTRKTFVLFTLFTYTFARLLRWKNSIVVILFEYRRALVDDDDENFLIEQNTKYKAPFVPKIPTFFIQRVK